MKIRSWACVFIFLCICSFAAWAQGLAGSPQSPDTITRPGSFADSGFYDYWNDMSGQGRAGNVLLGKLTVEGEPLPWDPMLVSVLCEGKVLLTAHTDVMGRFVIPTTKSICHPVTACSQTHPAPLPLEGCLVQASIAGFGSSSITITQRNLRDDPTLGMISIARRSGSAAGTALSETTKSASPQAQAFFEKARKEFLENKADKAKNDLQKVVQADPQLPMHGINLEIFSKQKIGQRPGILMRRPRQLIRNLCCLTSNLRLWMRRKGSGSRLSMTRTMRRNLIRTGLRRRGTTAQWRIIS